MIRPLAFFLFACCICSASRAQGSEATSCATNQSPIDLVWGVLPNAVVRDSYGHYVTTRYFAIQVLIRNNSADTLNVTGFEIHQTAAPSKPFPSMDWKLVRASIEKGHETGRRNISVNGLKGGGAIAGGLNGFFKNVASAATYGRFVSVYSGPFVALIESLYPDTTVRYLSNWDENPIFKNGFVIDKCGKAQTGIIFIPIQTLFPEYKKPRRRDLAQYDPDKVRDKITAIYPIGQIYTGDVKRLEMTTVHQAPQE